MVMLPRISQKPRKKNVSKGGGLFAFPEDAKKTLQWNFFIADMLYSGHFSTADTFPKNG